MEPRLHRAKTLLEPLLPGLQGLLDGPWLFAGVLGALIIRKPGAAIYTETLAAVVSALVGNAWGGFLTIEAGLVQGLGAELIVLLFLYRRFSLPVAILAGAERRSPAASTTSSSGTPVRTPRSPRSTSPPPSSRVPLSREPSPGSSHEGSRPPALSTDSPSDAKRAAVCEA